MCKARRNGRPIMGTLSMDMSSYEIERDEAMASGYGEEVLCAGWIPSHSRLW